MVLTDNETKVDLLNTEPIAATIVELLLARPDRPVTIGVHGDWGAGKSSILEMIEAGLGAKDDVLCLKFNGWRFQGFEDAKIALIEGIVTALVDKRPALRKAGDVVKRIFKRIDWLKVAKKAGGLALTAFTGIPTPEQVHAIVQGLEKLAADPLAVGTKENITALVGNVERLLKPGDESKHVPEEVAEFLKEFDALLKAAGVAQVVVLIDDLDRCLPDTAIETLEAVRLFVFTARTAFVVAADEAMIEYSVRKHFPELPDTTGPRDYARNYLEKLIQVPFRIPALGMNETRTYVTLLLIGARLGENDESYGELITIARERLKRPWESAPLDAASIRDVLKEKTSSVQEALALSDQTGPILSKGTQGNPRQIKRFLNSLLLRQRIAAARGFGELVKLPVLAKLMLAERFQPRFFDQIAFSAASTESGRCPALAELEAAITAEATAEAEQIAESTGTKSGRSKKSAPADTEQKSPGPTVGAWLASEEIRAWVAVQPALAEIDLRPYLFVAKDRRDYFGAVSVLGHLTALADQLMGSKFAVQGLAADLRQLKPAEAANVFEVLRGRIMSGDDFTTAPAGIDGLTVLVKAHSDLQSNVLDFLEALPVGKLGGWVVQGWAGVIDTTHRARLMALLQKWESSTNARLKAVAPAALKALQGDR